MNFHEIYIYVSQLQIFHSNYSLPLANGSIHDVIALVQGFSAAEKDLMSNYATNGSERHWQKVVLTVKCKAQM